MGGGFMFDTPSSVAAPPFSASAQPFSAAGSFPTGSQPHYFSENDSVFGPVPSRVEVENAIIELQRFMRSLPNNKSEVEGVGQIYHHHHHSSMLQSDGFTKFSEAWAMMQAEPPLQNLVVSIACDKAVWEAIKNNEAIHDLSAGKCEVPWNGGEEDEKYDELTEAILRWLVRLTKFTIAQLVEKFVSLVNEMFQIGAKERGTSSQMLDHKVGSSFLLSLVILVVVIVTRAHG